MNNGVFCCVSKVSMCVSSRCWRVCGVGVHRGCTHDSRPGEHKVCEFRVQSSERQGKTTGLLPYS